MPFIVTQVRGESCKVLKPWFGLNITETVSIRELFNNFTSGALDGQTSILEAYSDPTSFPSVSVGQTKSALTPVDIDTKIGEVVQVLGNFIEFSVSKRTDQSLEVLVQCDSVNDVLMRAAQERHHLPSKWTETSQQAKLKNGIIDWLQEQSVGWSPAESESLGVNFIHALSSALWGIDGNHQTLSSRGCVVPCELAKFEGYNKPELHKKRKINASSLTQAGVSFHSTALLELSNQAYMHLQRWQKVRSYIQNLANNLRKYSNYLQNQQETTSSNAKKLSFSQTERELWETINPKALSDKERVCFGSLEKALLEADDFQPICLNDFTPSISWQKYNFMKNLVVPCRSIKYTYSSGMSNLSFIWKVPSNCNEATLLSRNIQIRERLTPDLSKYHSRAMKREFIQSFGTVTNCKPAFLRKAYQVLTGDSSSARTLAEKEVDERVAEILEMQDPELISDLRVNNEGRPEKYEAFLQECQNFINVAVETAVDDRRHGEVHNGETVVHLATALSVPDLHAQVKESCPEDTPIPSVQWLRLQFWPRRKNSAAAKRYYGSLKIKYMIQARQFRHQHIDAHYASALFRYLKEFSLKYREHTTFVCMDDKHSMKVGEPGYPVAAVERGREVLVAMGTRFEVGDHDFTKLSMIPSVILKLDIPDTVEGSWYNGTVSVGLKEHTFQPSSAIRHVTELDAVLQHDDCPILALYTDGGPDHRVNYLSVEIALICLFLQEDRDMLIAVRTPPYNSWKDPAERVMSVLNCGAQGVGLMRQQSPILDPMIKNCNNMKSLRRLDEDNPNAKIKEKVLLSVQPTKDLLESTFKRLTFGGTPLKTFEAASDDAIDSMWSGIERIDETVTPNDTTKAKIRNKTDLNRFLDTHCQCRHYMFSIKKCKDVQCKFHLPPMLPDELFDSLHHLPDPIPSGERYKPFSEIYEAATTEKHRPSLSTATNGGHGIPFNPTKQTAKNVDRTIQCSECGKWRLLHSKNKITGRDQQVIEQALEEIIYSCGANICDVADDGELQCLTTVYSRSDLSCQSKIELPYYSAGFEAICIYCGTTDGLEDDSPEYYPRCQICSGEGKQRVKRRTRFFNANGAN